MKKLKFTTLILACIALTFYACKEEEVNSQEFVQKHFIGKWPLKAHIEITVKNKDSIKKDTTLFSPIDTVLFTSDGRYSIGNIAANYSIDIAGENLSITTTPPTNWKIKFLRNTSIILSRERTEKVGNDTFTYYTEEQLIK